MAAADNILFWGLVGLWMALAFTAWGLSFSGDRRGWRRSIARGLGLAIMLLSVVFFLPFFLPLELLPPSYITVTNASVALFVGLGIIMSTREPTDPSPRPPAGESGGEGGVGPPGDISTVEVAHVEAVPLGPAGGKAPGATARGAVEGRRETIDCPQCGGEFDVNITSMPMVIKCPHCGVEGELD